MIKIFLLVLEYVLSFVNNIASAILLILLTSFGLIVIAISMVIASVIFWLMVVFGVIVFISTVIYNTCKNALKALERIMHV